LSSAKRVHAKPYPEEQLWSENVNYPAPIRPSWWYMLLAIPGLLVGIGVFAYFLGNGLKSVTATLTQVVVPGRAVLNVMSPASYTIFLERPSMVNGKIYSSSASMDALTCNMTKQLPSQTSTESPRTAVTLRRPSVSLNYSLGNRRGRSVLEFQADEVALYHLSCGYPEGKEGPETVLAIGTGVGARIAVTLMRSFWGLMVGIALSAAVIIAIFVKRDRMRRASLLEMNRANHARLAGGIPQPPHF
jgi:hypothetical protein